MADNIKLNSISDLIAREIEKYTKHVETNDVGQVVSVGDGIATIYGLDNAMYGELLEFPNSIYGMVMNLDQNSVGAVLFSDDDSIREGDVVHRTNRVVSVPVGDGMMGRVVNALGQPIDGRGEIVNEGYRPVEMPAPSIMDRQSVDVPLETGIKAIDSMIPIGRGQRELIIGDRQTGKTALAIDTIINQRNKNVICVYCAIGQKNSTIAQIVDKLKQHDALKYTCIVDASASEPAPMLYLAPYSAVSIAEHWMWKGRDVLIVYDDLSKHAVAYRTLSLLLKRSPGREAYPGDIFYLHSRLLERSCRLRKDLGGSITALPIAETQAGDISAYIPTNLISITDGQIFLNTDMFNSGQRPAIDAGLSVSRVGSTAQTKAMKSVSKTLKMELASYHEMLDFARFGSDLDISTRRILAHGSAIMEVLKQKQYMPLSNAQEVMDIYVAQKGYLDNMPKADIHRYLKMMDSIISSHNPEVYASINDEKVLKPEIAQKIDEVFQEVNRSLSTQEGR
ncbi:MAG TPA: F0F1 ATP synthase subunit alpha [Firmicutes bacterium]|nr:F0F1 ATP synthase subunit alpha [Bacillota bacterium]